MFLCHTLYIYIYIYIYNIKDSLKLISSILSLIIQVGNHLIIYPNIRLAKLKEVGKGFCEFLILSFTFIFFYLLSFI